MLIITAGRTGPNPALRFGGDASLDDAGRRSVMALALPDHVGMVAVGPERAATETAALVGSGRVAGRVVDDLRTLDVGAWTGRLPEEIPPPELGAWFADPASHPHGGESISDFVARIQAWRTTTSVSACVVSMPVAQALLVDDPARYFVVEVRPATIYQR